MPQGQQQEHAAAAAANKSNKKDPPLIQCADLILPWLTPLELANISSTCKALSQISKSITLQRTLDASRFLENHLTPFLNPNNQHPYAYFLYTPSQLLPSQSPLRQPWGSQLDRDSLGRHHGGSACKLNESWEVLRGSDSELATPRRVMGESGKGVCGCDCEGCEEGGTGWEFWGLEEMGIMTECGPGCGCGLECSNRLTQRGVLVKLKIVRDGKKGWGLFADQMICQGQFICEYAGELLTTEEARRRQQIYDELASSGQFSSALLVVREHLPSGKACLRINIDATRTGNVARFINHSCDGGNLTTVLVRHTGSLLPRLCFFASRNIKEGEELTFSYGEIRVRSKGLQCFCGSSWCFGTLPSEHT
ncbi:histone-lysine N-methyltransferase SUVR3 [Populus nigra]|uniref:histone-lysine N-methyltransferase SUVR3 n=1 Tax=Populus nigra TaxID=3691 RepID=UPI002B27A662|nr:histone-lysine N-methyltransferase SUVR3 [Populus nigra]